MKIADLHRWLSSVLLDDDLTPMEAKVATRLMLHMNSLTGLCNPSIATIARGCVTTPRTVERSIKALDQAGWLWRSQAGGLSSNRYELMFRHLASEDTGTAGTPPSDMSVASDTPDTLTGYSPTCEPDTPRHVNRTNGELNDEGNGEESVAPQSIDSSKQDLVPPDGFDEFWRTYPLKIARNTAIRAYAKALKSGARAEQILEGARRYESEQSQEDPKFTKHPTTWLNGGCWDDQAQPPRSTSPMRHARAGRTREALIATLNRGGNFDPQDDDHDIRSENRAVISAPRQRF